MKIHTNGKDYLKVRASTLTLIYEKNGKIQTKEFIISHGSRVFKKEALTLLEQDEKYVSHTYKTSNKVIKLNKKNLEMIGE